MKCELCEFPLPPERYYCPRCKHINLGGLGIEDEDTVLLSDANLQEVERIDLGFLNPVFGGGLARTSTNLIAGPPGAGKTTLFLQLCDIIIDQFPLQEALYVASEQAAGDIKTTARRIRTHHTGRIRIVKALGGLKRDLGSIILQYRPCLIIVDSLSKLVGEDLELGVRVANRLKDYSAQIQAPSLIVNQINKEGDFAGLKKLEHEVDATFMLEKDDQTGDRFLYSTKNRFGEAPKGIELRMTSQSEEVPGKLVLKEAA